MTSIRRRRGTLLCLVIMLALAGGALSAQEHRPGPWIPIGSRLDGLVTWLIEDGALHGIDPLTRPYRIAAIREAAATQDSAALTTSAWRILGWLQRELAFASESTTVVAEIAAGAWRNGRRDSFRPGASAGTGPSAGVWVHLVRGPLVVVLNPAFDNRLKDDPEYTGRTDRIIAGRMQTSYVALTGERGDVGVGRMARNWGPTLFDGLQLSPSSFATDQLTGTIRIGRLELTTMAQRLDDYDTTLTATVTRWFLAHRLTINAGRGTWIAFTETGVYGGPGRGFEPAFLAPVNPALLTEVNEKKDANLMWGAQLHVPIIRGVAFEAEGMIDDIQIDHSTLTDQRPWSGGITLILRGALPALPVHLAVGYTQVRSLTYRNNSAAWNVYAAGGVGMARNYSDYDQLLLRVETRPTGRSRWTLDATWIRQGSGDFRQPFPSDSTLATPGQ